jgi:hypothetical protein
MPEIDYVPVATGTGANVDTQANFVGSGYQTQGFQNGIAQPYQVNKILRQSSMMVAALANVISVALGGVAILDDGNLANLITNLTSALNNVVKTITGATIDSSIIGGNTPAAATFTGVTTTSTRALGAAPSPLIENSSYFAWNQSAITGETDFINQYGTGSGGFNWYSTTGTSPGSPIASMTAQGKLTVSTVYLSNALTFSTATAGSASALPSAPAGYIEIIVNSTTVKLPYYGV